jgi:hypothetical protein
MSRRVSGKTARKTASSLSTSRDQPTSTTAHNIYLICDRVVPPEDGKVIPETCRDIEPQTSVSKSEVCIKLVVFIT